MNFDDLLINEIGKARLDVLKLTAAIHENMDKYTEEIKKRDERIAELQNKIFDNKDNLTSESPV